MSSVQTPLNAIDATITAVNAATASKTLAASIGALLEVPARLASAVLAGPLAQRVSTCGCEIPPPCWEPQPAGSCSLTLAPNGRGAILLRVSNCGWTPQVVHITAPGQLAAWVTFIPTTLVIGPQETRTFGVRVHAPPAALAGAGVAGPILIRGCRDHFVRVDVRVAECAVTTACAVEIRDCADNVHHWYDHFYCPRPCNDVKDTGRIRNG